jgi:hypothetical protein
VSSKEANQQQLPPNYQIQEYLQDWLKDETIPRILNRLAHSTAIRAGAELGESFGVA